MAGERKFNDQPLGAVIRQMLRNAGMDRRYRELDIIAAWHQVVGPLISKRTTWIQVRERTLHVRIDSGVIREELLHQRSGVIASINERLGEALIDELELR